MGKQKIGGKKMENNTAIIAGKFKILIILAIVAALSLGVNRYNGNQVSLNLDGEIIQVVSYSNTVDDFIKTEEIKMKEGAFINVPLDRKLENDIEIVIKNPKPYTLDVGGVLLESFSVNNTVKEVLQDFKIELGEKDYTFPELSSTIAPNSTIKLFQVKEVIETEDTIIPFESQITKNRNIEAGVINVIQEGKDGLRRSHIQKEYVNGILSSSVIVKDEIVSEPVTHIVEKGDRDFIVTSRGQTRYKTAITMEATAYDLSFASTGKRPGDRYYGITASGTQARPGAVAVDPRVIPLGTKLYIQSLDGTKDYGFAIAEDTGGAIKGNRIDLFFQSNAQCKSFGRRNVKVYILK